MFYTSLLIWSPLFSLQSVIFGADKNPLTLGFSGLYVILRVTYEPAL